MVVRAQSLVEDEGMKRLAAAIVMQAIEDYREPPRYKQLSTGKTAKRNEAIRSRLGLKE